MELWLVIWMACHKTPCVQNEALFTSKTEAFWFAQEKSKRTDVKHVFTSDLMMLFGKKNEEVGKCRDVIIEQDVTDSL